jgi:hypothetical protein
LACEFTDLNKECLKKKCPYYPRVSGKDRKWRI